jgi:hypothetical protein
MRSYMLLQFNTTWCRYVTKSMLQTVQLPLTLHIMVDIHQLIQENP